jgi:hypothetical protein
MNLQAVNRALTSLKDYGPYGICFALMLIGSGMFSLGGGSDDVPAQVIRASGAAACALGVICFALWHFRKWPPWFKMQSRRRS